MSEEKQPYECLPEGDPHAATDYITRLLAGLLLALIVLVASACPAQAGENWCQEWQQGYQDSFYIVCRQCQTIEPKQCPEPDAGETDGYMRGVKDGAAEGKKAQREWI